MCVVHRAGFPGVTLEFRWCSRCFRYDASSREMHFFLLYNKFGIFFTGSIGCFCKGVALNWQNPLTASKLKWLPMKDWVKYRKATMTFKAINGNAPDYISSMFKPVGEVHSRTTRQTCKNDLYLPPRAKLNVYRNTLRYSGALIWNDLPANVKHVPSVQMFKSNYLQMYFN